VVVGLVVVTVLAWWMAHEGGFGPGAWYPGALLLLALLVAVVRPAGLSGLPARGRWSVLLFAAFTAWSYLSIAWADARGDAWDSANRALLYLTVFVLFAGLRWRRVEAAAVLGAFVLLTVTVGMLEIVIALVGDASRVFESGRLAGPIGYENASAALFGIAFWQAVVLAADRAAPRPARAVLLAMAGLLLELCVLTQSRGSLISLTAGLVCALALTRERARLLLALSATALAALLSLPALVAVFDRPPDTGGTVLDTAMIVMALSAVALSAVGWASPRLDGWSPTRRLRPGLHLGWGTAAVVAILAAGALAASSRFTAGVESGRYDFWRVAMLQVADHPLQGAGAGNFTDDYARERHRHEQPQYPHSIVLDAFGQTGVVGGLLLLGFLATALLSATRGPVAVAAAASAAAWLGHASIDWLWEVPAVTAPAMACLGLVVGAARPNDREDSDRPLWLARVLALGVALAAAVSYMLPALAAREIERAVRRWDSDPAGALRELDRARRLNPLTDRADVVAGALTLESGDRAVARRAFERAAVRDPGNWYPRAALGLLELQDGARAAAIAQLRQAQRMDPREPAITAALAAAQQGRAAPPGVRTRLVQTALPGPLGRRPATCRPVLGLATACSRRFG
jgi:hypothetical protein